MKRLSLIAIIISALLFAGHDLQLKRYNNPNSIFDGDVISYYQVLPAIFIEHDLTFSFLQKPIEYPTAYWPIFLENGKGVSKVSLGMAYLYLPFFLVVHYSLEILSIPAHGFSYHYKIALLIAAIFYTTLALLMIRKLLLEQFSDSVVAITILIIALGTNLFHYASTEGPMSHAFSFFLITSVFYFTNKFYKKPKSGLALIIGLFIGLTTLIRPTNLIVAVIPVLWGVSSLTQFRNRLFFWFSRWGYLLMAIAGFILIWMPQVIYWKYITGHFFFNGYGDDGVKFFFDNPQIINSFFSYRKGWLLYTPVMSFAVLGFIFLKRYCKENFFAITIYFGLSVYVISSWWLWWYGGGYGLRAYIDIYGAMAFPLAAFIAFVFYKRKLWVKSLVILIMFIFIAHNLFQVKQIHYQSIHFSDMTKEAYWESFGHLKPTLRLNALLVPLDYKSAAKGIYPKPVVKVKTEQDWINFYMRQISSDSNYMVNIGKKATEKGISIDEALYNDAKWCYEADLDKHEKEKKFFLFY